MKKERKCKQCLVISSRRPIENHVFDEKLKEKSHHDSCDCVVLIVIEVERATEARAFEFDDWRAGENLEGFRRIRK